MTEIEWTDAEREAVRDVFRRASFGPQDVLDALAPHVAARESQAAAKAWDDGYQEGYEAALAGLSRGARP